MASNHDGKEQKEDNSLSMKLVCFGIRQKFSKVHQLSTEQLAAWLDDNRVVTLLDTRPESEYNISKIPGATRVDPDDLKAGLLEADRVISNTPEDQAVVLYCSVGYRSSMVADKLLQKSQTKDAVKRPIYNLEGSIFKWANENRPIVNNEGAVAHFVHPYNSVFGKLLDPSRRYSNHQTIG